MAWKTVNTAQSMDARSQNAFRKVDFEYPSKFAAFALLNKVKHYLIISSLGADAKSGNFYLKIKI